jgi:hypothetical protein
LRYFLKINVLSFVPMEAHMIRVTQFFLTTFCLCCLLLAFQQTAQAYADPGSGLLALQIIGSTLAGVGFYFRQKVGKFFMRRRYPAEAGVVEANGHDNSSNSAPK